jgi:hypothetical protein
MMHLFRNRRGIKISSIGVEEKKTKSLLFLKSHFEFQLFFTLDIGLEKHTEFICPHWVVSFIS